MDNYDYFIVEQNSDDIYFQFRNEFLSNHFESFPIIIINNLIYTFNFSTSKNFNKAKNILKKIGGYELDGVFRCVFNSNEQYINNFYMFNNLYDLTINWKGSFLSLNDKMVEKNNYKFLKGTFISEYMETMRISDYVRNNFCEEDLPYKYVFYPNSSGAFLAFSKDKKEWVLCECERDAFENARKLLDEQHMINNGFGLTKILPFDSNVKFVSGVCHICNNAKPTTQYCHKMYGSLFKQNYGWYIAQSYYKLGINPINMKILEETPQEYKDLINKNEPELRKIISSKIENEFRKKLDFPQIGEKYIGETQLYKRVCNIFPDFNIIKHYRPKWLKGLELDVFIEDLNVAIEFQGQQHYMPIKLWGGKKALISQKERDNLKREICNKEGIKLIEIKYDESYDDEYLKRIILN